MYLEFNCLLLQLIVTVCMCVCDADFSTEQSAVCRSSVIG